MLKQETIDKICGLLKIKPADFTAAIKAEAETDLPIDEKLNVFTEDEVTQVKANEYKKGKQAGVEMEIKEAKEKHGLDFNGKTIEQLLEANSKKVLADAKIEPEKKVTELQEKITTLQKTVGEQEQKLAEKDGEISGVKIHGELIKHIPANTSVSNDKVIGLMKMDGYEFKSVEGKVVAFKDGKQLEDKLANAMTIKDVISGYIAAEKLAPEEKQQPGGRGGKDQNTPGVYTKLSEIKEKYKAEGKSTLGTEFSNEVSEAAKLPEFDMQG